jgi:hypothetical protein
MKEALAGKLFTLWELASPGRGGPKSSARPKTSKKPRHHNSKVK